MVRAASSVRRFMTDRSGMALTEALLVIPLMMLVFAAMIEFGAMVFQWNQTVKALQVAARRAAVSTELTDISSLNAYGTIPIAEPLPASSFASVVCGAGATPCDPVQLNRLLQGGDGVCGGYDPSGVVGVCDIAPFIRASHLRVGYHRSDLGYSGRPYGPVLTVTLEVRDLYFDFFILDKVMELFQPIGVPHSVPVPAHPVAITSEDLCNGKTCP